MHGFVVLFLPRLYTYVSMLVVIVIQGIPKAISPLTFEWLSENGGSENVVEDIIDFVMYSI